MLIDSPEEKIPTFIKAQMNKKQFTKRGNYYMLTSSSDSTVNLRWGNDTVRRVYHKEFDFFSIQRLRGVKWENEDYIMMLRHDGSDDYMIIVLPLNNWEKTQEINNGLLFDSTDNFMVREGFLWEKPFVKDTILVISNLITHKQQFITEKGGTIAFHSTSCIDSLSIHNKLLYYKWVPSTVNDKNKKSVARRIRITI